MAKKKKKKKGLLKTGVEVDAMQDSQGANDTNFFWQSKYTTGATSRLEPSAFLDASDALANGGKYVISFKHVASEASVFFKAFVTSYSENFNSEWKTETVFGRTDPIYTFGNNRRTVDLGFVVPASSESEAFENLGRIQMLSQMIYPAYTKTGTKDDLGREQLLMSQAPLVRIKMMNLIQKSGEHKNTDPNGDPKVKSVSSKRNQIYQSYLSSNNPDEGLLCAINNISISTDMAKEGVLEKAPNTVMPVNYTVKIGFNVIHEETIGWDAESGMALQPTFPYGATMWDPTSAGLAVDSNQNWNQRLDKERNLQAAQDSARARYGGLFGGMRAKRDYNKYENNKKYMMGIPWSGMPDWMGGGERDPATAGSYEDYMGDAAVDEINQRAADKKGG